jgi:hypothetical protein
MTGPGAVGLQLRRAALYRQLLRAYPLAWRRRHGEVLLGTLLDVDDARGGTGPTPGEVGDLVIRGLGVRLAYLTPGRSTRERASAVALTFGTGLTMVCMVLGEWWAGLDGAYGSWDGRDGPAVWWPFPSAGPAYFLLWPLTLVALVTGRGRWWGRWARWLPVLGMPVAWAVYAVGDRWGLADVAGWPVVGLAGLGLVAAMAGPPRSARHGVRLLAGTAAVTVVLLLDAVRIIGSGGPHPVQGAPVIFPDRPGYHLQMQLFGDTLIVIIALLVVATAVAWWWRPWFPVLLLVGSALTWWIIGPVGLLGITINIGATAVGFQLPAKAPLVEWAVGAVACGVVAVLAILARWQYGRPVRGRVGEASPPGEPQGAVARVPVLRSVPPWRQR